MIEIVSPKIEEYELISKFLINIFKKNVSHLYNEMGNHEFLNHVHSYKLYERGSDITCYTQFILKIENEICGFMETRESSHITLLFVKNEKQKKGYGKSLFLHAEEIAKSTGFTSMTLNSSPNSLEAYEKWGFLRESDENCINGIRYFQMRKKIERN